MPPKTHALAADAISCRARREYPIGGKRSERFGISGDWESRSARARLKSSGKNSSLARIEKSRAWVRAACIDFVTTVRSGRGAPRLGVTAKPLTYTLHDFLEPPSCFHLGIQTHDELGVSTSIAHGIPPEKEAAMTSGKSNWTGSFATLSLVAPALRSLRNQAEVPWGDFKSSKRPCSVLRTTCAADESGISPSIPWNTSKFTYCRFESVPTSSGGMESRGDPRYAFP